MRRLLVFLTVLLLPIGAAAQDTPAKKPPTKAEAVAFARAWLDGQRAYDQIPGMSAAVVHDQDILWSGGSGFADPATKRTATPDTIYSICSISKLFTSVAVMQLRDQGKVALDQPVSKYLGWFTMQPPEKSGPVTVEGILTHSSGLPRESDYPYWTGKYEFPTHDQIVERLKSQKPLYPSDTYFQYSNLGMTLAGEIVSAQSGTPYPEYVRAKILEPLGLESTTTEVPLDEKGKRLAVGHSAMRRDGSRAVLPIFQVRGIAPAAGFASTATDLAKFASWQFRALDRRDDAVLSGLTLREMHRVHWVDPDFKTYWGLGFAVTREDDKTFVRHGGSCPGFQTQLMLQPDDKIGVAVLANASGVNIGGYARALHDIFAPAASSKAETPSAAIVPYLGSYDVFPWGGELLFFSWGGELASVALPTMTPLKNIERYRKTGDNTFRRIRKDNTLGEEYVFELGPDGRATRYTSHSNPYPRMTNVKSEE
ncbi:MAG: serine hydrolase domain-containing protein [Thermoanaerobaculia bacterium]